MEKWETISNYTDYEVSDTGNIRKKNTAILLNQSVDADGHLYVCITIEGKKKILRTRFEVAKAFIPNVMNAKRTRTINGILTDVRAENIEWVTPDNKQITAAERLERKEKKTAKKVNTRKQVCLKCHKTFTTELDNHGIPYNKLCPKCHEENNRYSWNCDRSVHKSSSRNYQED